ncbi:hypothetical protein VP01_744g1 [Puccinia sorghi]|uniref:Uncharacterized protein n=1 Tax=Puccinia sorghi TaxID=27349 RepID=A0A0L6UCH8_9BASI|nr:hypothetical protein VP01_744g1 [Puccinia sorghi]
MWVVIQLRKWRLWGVLWGRGMGDGMFMYGRRVGEGLLKRQTKTRKPKGILGSRTSFCVVFVFLFGQAKLFMSTNFKIWLCGFSQPVRRPIHKQKRKTPGVIHSSVHRFRRLHKTTSTWQTSIAVQPSLYTHHSSPKKKYSPRNSADVKQRGLPSAESCLFVQRRGHCCRGKKTLVFGIYACKKNNIKIFSERKGEGSVRDLNQKRDAQMLATLINVLELDGGKSGFGELVEAREVHREGRAGWNEQCRGISFFSRSDIFRYGHLFRRSGLGMTLNTVITRHHQPDLAFLIIKQQTTKYKNKNMRKTATSVVTLTCQFFLFYPQIEAVFLDFTHLKWHVGDDMYLLQKPSMRGYTRCKKKLIPSQLHVEGPVIKKLHLGCDTRSKKKKKVGIGFLVPEYFLNLERKNQMKAARVSYTHNGSEKHKIQLVCRDNIFKKIFKKFTSSISCLGIKLGITFMIYLNIHSLGIFGWITPSKPTPQGWVMGQIFENLNYFSLIFLRYSNKLLCFLEDFYNRPSLALRDILSDSQHTIVSAELESFLFKYPFKSFLYSSACQLLVAILVATSLSEQILPRSHLFISNLNKYSIVILLGISIESPKFHTCS